MVGVVRRLLIGLSVWLASVGAGRGEPPGEREMAAQIDRLLAAAWEREGVTPAPPATDSEFLRRAWLDLNGTLPPLNHDDGISGARDFLNSPLPDKRRRLIERLLNKPSHASHLATIWRNALLPADVNVQRLGGDAGFRNWLRGQFADRTPYDQLVDAVLLSSGAANQTGPALFYAALELQPEALAASTSRVFLGTQIQCAQCHNHPFDHWTREDFWGYAAFFARLTRPARSQQVAFQVSDSELGEVTLPDSDTIVAPRYLGGEASPDEGAAGRRQRLAAWLTSGENPFFARAAANRVWALMFGRGIVDPVDDLGQHNPPSHPELLDALAAYFVDTGFDLDRLIRTLACTQAYQLSSGSTAGAERRPELFAQMAIKSLTAEQLYDCLGEAMRRRDPGGGAASPYGVADRDRLAFVARFQAPAQGATEYESGIPQALALMNGDLVRQATDLARSDLLTALDAPFFDDSQRVETLFLSTLSRMPSDEERAHFVAHVALGADATARRQALGDVLWALLNSAEFALNH